MRAKHFILVAAVVLAVSMAAQARAEVMFYWTDAGTTYTVVEATPFYSGETAENTVAIASPGTYWASVGYAAGKWRGDQAGYSLEFNTLPPANLAPTARDLCQGGSNCTGPDLRTTITGLANGPYEVFLVQVCRNDNPSAGDASLMRADIDVGQAAPATVRTMDDPDIVWTGYANGGPGGIWEVALNPLGQVTGTDIEVLVGRQGGQYNRSLYVGVAYYLVPEPSTLALLATGLIGLLCYAWRKRK